MSDELQKLHQQLAKKMAGPTPIEKHIILLKLTDLYENMPENFGQYQIEAGSPEREWLSAVRAPINLYDNILLSSAFNSKLSLLNLLNNAQDIVGIVGDVIEAIKLELELDGRSDIGTVYKSGEVYRFFADMQDIIAGAKKQVFLIEPYLDGQAFDKYFGAVRDIELRLLISKSGQEIKAYADQHSQQYKTSIELRKSKEIHDRLIVADQGDVWVIGGSLNMKGDKPTYLLPLTPGIAESTRGLYSDIWDQANPVS